MKANAPTSPTTTDSKAVVFVDLLGFATLTEQHSLELEHIKNASRPLSAESFEMILAKRENPLTRAFTSFHRSLKSVIDLAQMQYSLTAVTFSDSAFIATTHLYCAADIAIRLQHYLLPQQVPARIGIAYGSFSAVRFRSDVTGDGGDHAAHFLGTGVVRSYAAERCGIKGLRILVHPTAMQHLSEVTSAATNSQTKSISVLRCLESEANNSAGVQYEVNYWRFAPTAEANAWRALQDMWDAAPERELRHFEATAEAIDRMRIQRGKHPLTNLRRRTLPKTRQAAV